MSLINEYIEKKWAPQDYQNELHRLIKEYNKLRNTFLFVYAASMTKNIPDVSIGMDDYFVMHDLLKNSHSDKIDFYIETPGGSGETVEEIVGCLRKKFKEVNFIISGEAKSAGTILVLSGDEIYMTDTGSLGPVDAQVKIGRNVISAYDYLEWVEEKRIESQKNNYLNPFDATVAAQISPGELKHVHNALHFAQDLIKDWLPKYKFRNWTYSSKLNREVTEDDKINRAEQLAKDLVNHSKWRSHARSLKREDLKEWLKIKRIDDDKKLSDIVYRIQTILKIYFDISNTYKIFSTKDNSIMRQATPQVPFNPLPSSNTKIEVVELNIKCNKCGKEFQFYAKSGSDPKLDKKLKSKGKNNLLGFNNNTFKCNCGFNINLMPIIQDIQNKLKRKLV